MICEQGTAKLNELRDEIAKLDLLILESVSKRLLLAEDIAEYKLRKDLPLRVPAAEEAVRQRNAELGDRLTLPKALVNALTELVIEASVRRQEEYLDFRSTMVSEK